MYLPETQNLNPNHCIIEPKILHASFPAFVAEDLRTSGDAAEDRALVLASGVYRV